MIPCYNIVLSKPYENNTFRSTEFLKSVLLLAYLNEQDHIRDHPIYLLSAIIILNFYLWPSNLILIQIYFLTKQIDQITSQLLSHGDSITFTAVKSLLFTPWHLIPCYATKWWWLPLVTCFFSVSNIYVMLRKLPVTIQTVADCKASSQNGTYGTLF